MKTTSRCRPALLAGLFAMSACAPAARGGTPPTTPGPAPAPPPVTAVGLPPIPAVNGALALRVVHPIPTTPLPRTDSAYVYGSAGTGGAALTINGAPVPVQPNGAWLAWLPVPADGVWRLSASAGGQQATLERAYRMPAPAAPGAPSPAPRPAVQELSPALSATVTGGADTLATGSDVTVGRPTPSGTYRWFLPRGARLAVTGRLGDQLRVRLDTAVAWIDAGQLSLGPPADTAVPAPLPPPTLTPAAGWVDVRIGGAAGAPFRIETEATVLSVVIPGRTALPGAPAPPADPMLRSLAWSGTDGSARADLQLAAPIWGYKAWYEPDGALVVRVRRPPALDPADPLRGARIVVDPGHPPAGATGPTGLTEAEANLAIGLRLAERLRARGAEVILTRADARPLGLEPRVELAVDRDAHLLVSVHNNALGEGVNPWRSVGTSTYHFHPWSADLARALDREIVAVTRIRDLGARVSNLALVRPTWMPSTLTESLFMLIPEQESALRDPAFLDRLADAHVRGIEGFLRGRLGVREEL